MNIEKRVVSHYVDNKEFTIKLTEWTDRQRLLKEQDKQTEQAPQYIAECILKICINLARKPNFVGYTFREEMSGDAVETCIRYVINFNGEKSRNAFAYISQIAYTAFIRRIKKEKLLNAKHIKFIKNVVDIDQLSAVVSGASDTERQHYESYLAGLRSIIDEVVDTPEEKKKLKVVEVESSILLDIMEKEGEKL